MEFPQFECVLQSEDGKQPAPDVVKGLTLTLTSPLQKVFTYPEGVLQADGKVIFESDEKEEKLTAAGLWMALLRYKEFREPFLHTTAHDYTKQTTLQLQVQPGPPCRLKVEGDEKKFVSNLKDKCVFSNLVAVLVDAFDNVVTDIELNSLISVHVSLEVDDERESSIEERPRLNSSVMPKFDSHQCLFRQLSVDSDQKTVEGNYAFVISAEWLDEEDEAPAAKRPRQARSPALRSLALAQRGPLQPCRLPFFFSNDVVRLEDKKRLESEKRELVSEIKIHCKKLEKLQQQPLRLQKELTSLELQLQQKTEQLRKCASTRQLPVPLLPHTHPAELSLQQLKSQLDQMEALFARNQNIFEKQREVFPYRDDELKLLHEFKDEVVGVVGGLATTTTVELQRVLSWHMKSNLRIIVLRSSSSRAFRQCERANKTVLPLDQLWRNPNWIKQMPLPHETAGAITDWSQKGNPRFAIDLLRPAGTLANDFELFRFLFGNLLGSLLVMDTQELAVAYRRYVTQPEREGGLSKSCPTILTRDGFLIRSTGIMGGDSNRACSLDELRRQGCGFFGLEPTDFSSLSTQCKKTQQLLAEYCQMREQHESLQAQLEQIKPAEIPELQAHRAHLEGRLQQVEARLVALSNVGGSKKKGRH